MIFLIRFLTATCLFVLLGKANIWLTVSSHAILVVSYRTLLIFSPYFTRYFGEAAILCAMLVAIAGIILFHFPWTTLWIVAALFTGLGLSVAGFLIKSRAAETPQGAGYNKIALNVGSLCAGFLFLLPWQDRDIFFFCCLIILCFSSLCLLERLQQQKTIKNQPVINDMTMEPPKKLQFAWGLIGIVVGIKLLGVFVVLPQYLLTQQSTLPPWYGILIFINSIVIIAFQLPMIKILSRYIERWHQPYLPLLILLIGMLIIATPQYFHAYTLIGAIIWTLSLSLVECCVSYLDVQSSGDGTLLIKESMVGIGGGLTVLLMRFLPDSVASFVVGGIGILLLLLAVGMLQGRNVIKNS